MTTLSSALCNNIREDFPRPANRNPAIYNLMKVQVTDNRYHLSRQSGFRVIQAKVLRILLVNAFLISRIPNFTKRSSGLL